MAHKPIYYWDTNIFFHWLKMKEIELRPEVLTVIQKIEDLVDQERVSLATSTIFKIELLQSIVSQDELVSLAEFFQRPNVTLISVDSRVADLAAEIRGYYVKHGNTLSTPDVIHLASALHYGADFLNTLDGSGKKSGHGKLLTLPDGDGKICGGKYGIKIKVPSEKQIGLFVRQGTLIEFRKNEKTAGE